MVCLILVIILGCITVTTTCMHNLHVWISPSVELEYWSYKINTEQNRSFCSNLECQNCLSVNEFHEQYMQYTLLGHNDVIKFGLLII